MARQLGNILAVQRVQTKQLEVLKVLREQVLHVQPLTQQELWVQEATDAPQVQLHFLADLEEVEGTMEVEEDLIGEEEEDHHSP